MNTLKQEIKKMALELNISEIEAITAMQGVLASRGDEKNLDILCELKSEYISKM